MSVNGIDIGDVQVELQGHASSHLLVPHPHQLPTTTTRSSHGCNLQSLLPTKKKLTKKKAKKRGDIQGVNRRGLSTLFYSLQRDNDPAGLARTMQHLAAAAACLLQKTRGIMNMPHYRCVNGTISPEFWLKLHQSAAPRPKCVHGACFYILYIH